MPTAMVYATSLKSRVVPMQLPVTTMRMLLTTTDDFADAGYDCAVCLNVADW